ncbi:VanZ family protein [Ureibacillus sinduriensis]|uniref:VanZ-like domain-containing protein n=1 Tax=Ureibacillus sinduriensis BLB-1 = JCM 15800 TaxID=1384057 RepID=A0A0A3HXQ0_9BACL|nr:VanZ family protein [Ureibacillus sinduriensis]KGR75148.1 hypothetical protein CD33_12815 [Ureibacillus sinduriensis BLB-1 = JCM 15800]
MDIKSIIGKLLPILPIASIAAVVIIGIMYLSYKLYRKRGGSKKASLSQFSALFLLLGWFVVVMVLTTFSRGAHFEGWVNLRLFSDYMNAWNQWSLSELQLIIFNMLMFAPLGFLLPLLGSRTRRIVPIILVSLTVTLGIELFQLFTKRGIFELNDILHNTIGSIAGYLLMRAILDAVAHRKLKLQPLFKALCLPLVFTLLFTGAMIVYHSKELGNLSIRPASAQNMNHVEVTLKTKLEKEGDTVSLYYSDQIHNLEYGNDMADLLQSSFNLSQKGGMRKDGFNRIWTLLDNSGKEIFLNYSLKDGTWNLYTENYETVSMAQEELNSYRDFYEKWLLSNGLLSEEATFSTQDENTLRWDMKRSIKNIAYEEKDFFKGFIMLIPSQNNDLPIDVFYDMKEMEYVRDIKISSPSQAYKEILNGNFTIYNDLKDGDKLFVNGYELDYTFDSKGYYQPVYKFTGLVNGQHWEALIPAAID